MQEKQAGKFVKQGFETLTLIRTESVKRLTFPAHRVFPSFFVRLVSGRKLDFAIHRPSTHFAFSPLGESSLERVILITKGNKQNTKTTTKRRYAWLNGYCFLKTTVFLCFPVFLVPLCLPSGKLHKIYKFHSPSVARVHQSEGRLAEQSQQQQKVKGI